MRTAASATIYHGEHGHCSVPIDPESYADAEMIHSKDLVKVLSTAGCETVTQVVTIESVSNK